jgi:periplasmic protein TonB
MLEDVSTTPSPAATPSPPPLTKTPNPRALRQAQTRLMSQLLYPPDAIAQGLEGEVIVLLTLDGKGNIRATTLARSSGHSLLDTAALNAARSLGRVNTTASEMLLPIDFALD